MSSTPTTNFSFLKPALADSRWDIQTNDNWDLLDTTLYAKLDIPQVNTHLASGNCPSIVAGDIETLGQIIYDAASNSIYEGMFLRIGPGGTTVLYKAPDQDEHWEDTDATDVTVVITPNSLLSVTPVPTSGDITTGTGSYLVSGKVSNSNNNTRILTIEMFDDGVSVGSVDVTVAGLDSGKIFTFSAAIAATIVSGSVITCKFSTTTNSDLTLLGTELETKLEIIKAFTPTALALFNQVNNIDARLFISTETVLAFLTRANIEFAVPSPYKKMFFFRDFTGDTWQVFYDEAADKFFYNKLSEAA